MSKIRVNLSYSEPKNTLYHRDFEIVTVLPAIGDDFGHGRVEEIVDVRPDPSNRDEVANYDYYMLTISHKEDTDFDEDDRNELTEEYIAISVNEPNHREAVLRFEFLPPTIVEADLILRGWYESAQDTHAYLYDVIKNVLEIDLAGDEEETEEFISHLFEQLFGISPELYERCVIENSCELIDSERGWKDAKRGNGTRYAQTDYLIGSDGFSVTVYAMVPYWVTEKYGTAIDDSALGQFELPKRTLRDLHPNVYATFLEAISYGVVHHEEGGVCLEECPSYFYLVSLVPGEVIQMAVQLDDILNAPFPEFLKKCGLTRQSLAERFCIPTPTVNEWYYRSGVRPYIRLMLAEACGLMGTRKE